MKIVKHARGQVFACRSLCREMFYDYRGTVGKLVKEAGRRCGSFSQLIAGMSHEISPTDLKSYTGKHDR